MNIHSGFYINMCVCMSVCLENKINKPEPHEWQIGVCMFIYFTKGKSNLKTEIMQQIFLGTHLKFYLLNENECSLPVQCKWS